MPLIAFAGRRKSGKSTAAEMVVTSGYEMGVTIRRVSFADPIREMFAAQVGVHISMLVNSDTKEEFRERMVAFADAKRAEDPNVFIHTLFKSILDGENVIIDDMRTIEELAAVIKVGGKPFKIEASKEQRERNGWKYDARVDNHYLETEMDLSGHTFYTLGGGRFFNNQGMMVLRADMVELVKEQFLPSKLLVTTAA